MSPDGESPVITSVVKKLAKEMLKSSIPKQVWADCADEINKAFSIGKDRIEKHKKNMERLNRKQLLS